MVCLQRKCLPVSFLSVASWIAKQPIQFLCSSLGETPSFPSPHKWLPHSPLSVPLRKTLVFFPSSACQHNASKHFPHPVHARYSQGRNRLLIFLGGSVLQKPSGARTRQRGSLPSSLLPSCGLSKGHRLPRQTGTSIQIPYSPSPPPHSRIPGPNGATGLLGQHFSWLFLLAPSYAEHAPFPIASP